jgi:hypothetical protein
LLVLEGTRRREAVRLVAFQWIIVILALGAIYWLGATGRIVGTLLAAAATVWGALVTINDYFNRDRHAESDIRLLNLATNLLLLCDAPVMMGMGLVVAAIIFGEFYRQLGYIWLGFSLVAWELSVVFAFLALRQARSPIVRRKAWSVVIWLVWAGAAVAAVISGLSNIRS